MFSATNLPKEPQKLISVQFHKWFQIPEEVRASVAHQQGPNPQRGYSKIGSESLGTVYRHDFAPKEQNPYADIRVSAGPDGSAF